MASEDRQILRAHVDASILGPPCWSPADAVAADPGPRSVATVEVEPPEELASPRPPGAGRGATVAAAVGTEERRASRLALVLGTMFGLAATGSSAAAVALPDLQGDLALSHATAAWTLSIYVLMLAVTTAIYGRIADIVGVRKPLVAGVAVMAAGALLSALSVNLPMLLAGRVLQGAGAGSVPVLATALISARFSGETRTSALGRVAGASSAVSALGPLAGGALAIAGGWRAVFALPMAGLLLLPAVAKAAPYRGIGGRLDLRGAGLVAATAAGLVLLLQSAAAGAALAGFGAALLLAGIPLTALHIRHRPDGFLPRAVVTQGRVLRAALAGASIPAAWFALLLAVPTALDARGWSPLEVGLILVPAAVLGVFTSRRAGWVLRRLGGRVTLGGSALLAAASLAMAAVAIEIGSPALLVLAICLVTLSFSIGQPTMVSEVSSAVAASVRGIALGAATLAFLAGGSVGSAAVGGLADVVGPGGALIAVTVLPVLAAGIVLTTGRRSERRAGDRRLATA